MLVCQIILKLVIFRAPLSFRFVKLSNKSLTIEQYFRDQYDAYI